MNLPACHLASLSVTIVGSIVTELEQGRRQFFLHYIRRNRSSRSHLAKTWLDVMSRRSRRAVQPSSVEALHILTVGFEHRTVVSFRPWGLREPPHILHSVFDANAADCDPLCWHGHLCRIEPEALLCKVKADLLH